MTCRGILIYWMNTVSVTNWTLKSVKQKWWSSPGQRQRYVIYVHLNLVIRILIKWMITHIWVFAIIGLDPLLKLKSCCMTKLQRLYIHSYKKGRRLNLPTDVMLKLFDMCVEPILLYGCEVWEYEHIDILEKVHTKFCKFIFGLSTFPHNMPIYGELGRYPLSVTIA